MTPRAFTIALMLGTFASLTLAGPATAFWRIWSKDVPAEKPQQAIAVPLKSVRDASCGRPDAVQVFGETAFMRRTADRQRLPEEAARAIAAAYMAETIEVSHGILGPYLASSTELVRDAARLSFGFIVLRRRGLEIGGEASRLDGYMQYPMAPELEVDRQYLMGVLALSAGNWAKVNEASKASLSIQPNYYNAQVLYSLSQLRAVEAAELSSGKCEATLTRIENLLLPLLQLGACPLHVAHFDLAAERYLPAASGASATKLKLVRRVYLAYVSKNDDVGRGLLAEYKRTFGSDSCGARLDKLDFGRTGSGVGR